MRSYTYRCDWCGRGLEIKTPGHLPKGWVEVNRPWQPERKAGEQAEQPRLADVLLCCQDHLDAYDHAVEKAKVEAHYAWSRAFEDAQRLYNRQANLRRATAATFRTMKRITECVVIT